MNLDELQDYLDVAERDSELKKTRHDTVNVAEFTPTGKTKPGTVRAEVHSELQKASSITERLLEIEIAQKLGYLLCKCTWPPQIMVLSTADFIYRCPRCTRVRDI